MLADYIVISLVQISIMVQISSFKDHVGQTVQLGGWVANARFSKTNIFLLFRDGSGFTQCVISEDEVGAEEFEKAKRLSQESSIRITGEIKADERQIGGHEVLVKSFEVVQYSADYPISNKAHGVRFLADHRHLWIRSKRQWAVLRVRNQIIMSIHDFFQTNGFVQTDSPILTGNACEGTTDLFETEFFGETAFLAQSGQLYGEAMAMAMGRIYTFGPTFRAEKSDTPRHLAEFWMIEPEMAFFNNEMNMDTIEAMIKHIIGQVLEKCSFEMEMLERDVEALQKVNQVFPRIEYTRAVEILKGNEEVNGKNAIAVQEADLKAAEQKIVECKQEIEERETKIKSGLKKGERKFNESKILELRGVLSKAEEQCRNIPKWIESAKNFEWGEDLGGSDETVLTRAFDAPVMVYNWPTKIKAFYMKEVNGKPELVKGVDLLAPEGYGEIVGGSERETDLDILIKKIKEHDLPMEEFEWYLDIRRFGSVPHAGFGLGLERIVRWVCGLDHLRETIPFPRRYGRLLP